MADPLWSSTSLLLHCEGADDGTSITDSSVNARTVTLNGGTKTKTSTYKFGSSSVLIPGSAGDCISLTGATLGSGSCTIEQFVRFTALPSSGNSSCIFACIDASGYGVMVALDNAGGTIKLKLWVSSTGSTWYPVNGALGSKTSWATDTWYHVAFEYNSTIVSPNNCYFVYVDGVQDIGAPGSATIVAQTIWKFGYGLAFFPLNGYFDEIRVTVNNLRYNGAFTPPSAQFSEGYAGSDYNLTALVKDYRADVSPYYLGV